MQIDGRFHLTYCSNIHPGETWAQVRENLAIYLPQVRDRVGWRGSFGIGLRLSAQAAATLEQPHHLDEFRNFLAKENFYVFTINGFPYGQFHGERVKEKVYLPDWTNRLRLDYSNRLASLLSKLIPAGMDGSVSTSPGAYKASIRSAADTERVAELMLRHVRFLVDLRARTGSRITLAI